MCAPVNPLGLGLVDSVVWRLTEIHAALIVFFTRAYKNLPNRNTEDSYEYTAFPERFRGLLYTVRISVCIAEDSSKGI